MQRRLRAIFAAWRVPAAVPARTALLGSHDTRTAAAQALGAIRDPRAAGALRPHLHDDETSAWLTGR